MTTENINFIKNNPKKSIIKLMIPILIGTIFVTLNSIIDSFWVSGLGSDALTAVGFVSPIFLGIVGIGLGIGIGTNSAISRLIGANNYKEANNTAIHALVLSIILSIIITFILTIFLKDILIILGASIVLNQAMAYGLCLFVGSFTILMPQILMGIFLAEGQVKKATIPLILIAILNMILNPIFIYSLNLNIIGSALATVIAQFIGLLLILYWLIIKNKSSFTFKKEKYIRKLSIFKKILIVGIPAGLEEIALTTTCIVLNLLILQVAGPDSVAAFTVAWRIVTIGIVPCIAIGSAAVTVSGIAYGAKNFKNLQITTRFGVLLSFSISLIIFICINLFTTNIALAFSYSENSAHLTPLITHILRLISFFILAESFGDVSTYVLQGMGKGITSLILIIFREIIFIISFVYLLGIILGYKTDGIYIGIDIGMIVGSTIAYIFTEIYINKIKRYHDNKK